MISKVDKAIKYEVKLSSPSPFPFPSPSHPFPTPRMLYHCPCVNDGINV